MGSGHSTEDQEAIDHGTAIELADSTVLHLPEGVAAELLGEADFMHMRKTGNVVKCCPPAVDDMLTKHGEQGAYSNFINEIVAAPAAGTLSGSGWDKTEIEKLCQKFGPEFESHGMKVYFCFSENLDGVGEMTGGGSSSRVSWIEFVDIDSAPHYLPEHVWTP